MKNLFEGIISHVGGVFASAVSNPVGTAVHEVVDVAESVSGGVTQAMQNGHINIEEAVDETLQAYLAKHNFNISDAEIDDIKKGFTVFFTVVKRNLND